MFKVVIRDKESGEVMMAASQFCTREEVEAFLFSLPLPDGYVPNVEEV